MNIKNKPKVSLGLFPVAAVAFLVAGATSLVAQVAPNAGAIVTNVATVSYEVDDVPQPDVPAEENFTIDALINPVVDFVSAAPVAPGETDAVLQFTVTNGGNQTQDFVLNGLNITGDDGDLLADNSIATPLPGILVYVDSGPGGIPDGIFDAADDILVDIATQTASQTGLLNDFDPGDSATIFIVGDIPVVFADTEEINVDLVAVAFQADGSGIETETLAGSADIDVIDTIFGDEAGTTAGDGDEDGVHSDTGTVTVANVTVTVTKTAAVIDNGLDDGSTDQFYIPGATVQYTITISYSGSVTTNAGSIVMSDPIPADTTYVDESIELTVGAAAADPLSDADDADEGDFDETTTGAVTIAVTGTRNGGSPDDVITFEVTIDE